LYLVFTSTNDRLGIDGDGLNPYSRGQTYANSGYVPFASYDYTFRTYYDDSLNTVPVPGAMLLGALGTGFVGYLRRRRTF
jgi:hypothetical protein